MASHYLIFILAHVFKEYQSCFHKTKQKLEQNPAERQFDFSEMYIFGKFETFHRRLLKIMHVFDTITTYSVLQNSKMEGLEVMATKYQVCRMSNLINSSFGVVEVNPYIMIHLRRMFLSVCPIVLTGVGECT